jgi:hypothetical protein
MSGVTRFLNAMLSRPRTQGAGYDQDAELRKLEPARGPQGPRGVRFRNIRCHREDCE